MRFCWDIVESNWLPSGSHIWWGWSPNQWQIHHRVSPGWSNLRAVSSFLCVVSGLAYLQALNTCLSLSWRLTNSGTPPAIQHVTRELLPGLGTTPLQPWRDGNFALSWRLTAAGQCHLWVLFNSAAVSQQTHQTLNWVLKVNLLFEMRRKEGKIFLF